MCLCGSPPRPGKATCERCNDKNKANYHRRKEQGICNCGNQLPEGRAVCLECIAVRQAKYQAVKDEVFNHYGGYVCECCGESIKKFLTIDHINNDGKEHRKELGSRIIYKWLKQNGFPEGFQVLCFNCNCGRQLNGGICPHKSH
jgi:hypothetical protein